MGGKRTLPAVRRATVILTFSALVPLSVTGLAGWMIQGTVSGWLLVMHMVAAPVFFLGVSVFAILEAERHGCRTVANSSGISAGRRLAFWAFLSLGCLSLGSILVAMPPLSGTADPRRLALLHRYSSLALVGSAIVMLTTRPRVGARNKGPEEVADEPP